MKTTENLINKAYSPEEFQKDAPKLMSMISGELKASLTREIPETIERHSPEEQLRFWQEDFLSSAPIDFQNLMKKVMSHSINFHSKGYVGHQVAVTLPVTALTSAMMAYMNNCTTVYELGMAGNAMEKVVISHLAEKFGYNKGATGFVASGGSMGNLTALVLPVPLPGLKRRIITDLPLWYPRRLITVWNGRPKSWEYGVRILSGYRLEMTLAFGRNYWRVCIRRRYRKERLFFVWLAAPAPLL